jgi:hypothetical protein
MRTISAWISSDFLGLSGQGMGMTALLNPLELMEEIFPEETCFLICSLKFLVLKKYEM